MYSKVSTFVIFANDSHFLSVARLKSVTVLELLDDVGREHVVVAPRDVVGSTRAARRWGLRSHSAICQWGPRSTLPANELLN